MVKKGKRQPFSAYQARVSHNGRIVETGGPYATKRAALKDAKEIKDYMYKGQKGYRISAARVAYSGNMKRPK